MFGGPSVFISLLAALLVGCATANDPSCDRHTPVSVMTQVYHCCKHPEGHNLVVEKCANQTGFKLHDPNDAFLDMNPENLLKSTCFSMCVFNESRFLSSNGSVDINKIRLAIQNDHVDDAEYVKEIQAAFEMCHSKAEEKKAEFMKSDYVSSHIKDKCDPYPSVILSCVITKFFKNCPSTRWTDSAQCNDAKDYLNKCEKKFG